MGGTGYVLTHGSVAAYGTGVGNGIGYSVGLVVDLRSGLGLG